MTQFSRHESQCTHSPACDRKVTPRGSVQSRCSLFHRVDVVRLHRARFLRSGHNCKVERKEKSRRLFETDLRIYERRHRLPVTLSAGRDLRPSLSRGRTRGCRERGGRNLAHYSTRVNIGRTSGWSPLPLNILALPSWHSFARDALEKPSKSRPRATRPTFYYRGWPRRCAMHLSGAFSASRTYAAFLQFTWPSVDIRCTYRVSIPLEHVAPVKLQVWLDNFGDRECVRESTKPQLYLCFSLYHLLASFLFFFFLSVFLFFLLFLDVVAF